MPLDPRIANLSTIMFQLDGSAPVVDLATRESRDPCVEAARGRLSIISQVVAFATPLHLYSSGLLFADALACTDDGQSVALAFMALEALLLEKDSTRDTVARLREAVAVHTGLVSEAVERRSEIMAIARDAIAKELDEMPLPQVRS